MSTVDLFSGPGGWCEAAKPLGIRPVGIEHDASACATRAAAGHLTIRADVSTWPTPRTRVTGLIASPPCQTFSAAGNRDGIAHLGALMAHVRECVTGWRPFTGADARTTLVLEPLRFALECVPDWIALEQVPDVLPIWEAYAYTLRALGWSVWTGILNAADFGVPQTRRRAILMAHRRKAVQPPTPTHCEGGAQTMFGELLPWVSMAAALGWCKPMQAGFPRRDDRGDSPDGYRERDWRNGDEPAFALTEKARSWVLRAGAQPHAAIRSLDEPAPTITASMDNGDSRFVLHTNRDQREDGSRQTRECSAPAPALSAKAGGQWAFDRPATTVQGDPRLAPPGHRDREGGEPQFGTDALKLSVADALKLQSFRADYPVRGTKTKQFEQLGNAIPPRLAQAILSALSAGSL